MLMGVITCELVAREVETLPGESSGVLEDANGDCPRYLEQHCASALVGEAPPRKPL